MPRPAVDPGLVARPQIQVKVKPAAILAMLLVGVFMAVGIGIFVCVSKVTTTATRQAAQQSVAIKHAEDQQRNAQQIIEREMRRVGQILNKAGVQMPSGPRDKAWKLNELDQAPKGSWFRVDTAGMTGTLAQFDAIANYNWMHKLAQAWSADSKLIRMSVRHLRHDAAPVDASDGGKGSADYRFYSPSRLAAAEKMSEVSEEKVYDGFRVWVEGGKVRAMISQSSPEARNYPHPIIKCNYKQILAGARPIARQPFYDLWLRYRKWGKRWEWSVDRAFSLKTRRPRSRLPKSATVNPTTCKRM